VHCFENPFRKAIKILKDSYEETKNNKEQQQQQQLKERWIEDANHKFELPLKSETERKKKTTSLSDRILQDYL
jgi:hypothetical protein